MAQRFGLTDSLKRVPQGRSHQIEDPQRKSPVGFDPEPQIVKESRMK